MSTPYWIQAFLGQFESDSHKVFQGIVVRVRPGSVRFASFDPEIQTAQNGTLVWGKDQKYCVTNIRVIKDTELPTALIECTIPSLTSESLYASRKNEQFATALLFDQDDRLTQALKNIRFPYDPLMSVPREIDTTTSFLGHQLSSPIYIVGMTGGSSETDDINRILAQAAERAGIAMAVGSQRWVLEKAQKYKLRQALGISEKTPLIGNIGISEVIEQGTDCLKKLQDLTGVDAIAIHLNILQEFMQPEGHRTFADTFSKLETAVRQSSVPLILKETGCGFSESILEKIILWDLEAIELTSTAGTNWIGLEGMRQTSRLKQQLSADFLDVGHDAQSQVQLFQKMAKHPQRKAKLVASGGITRGQHVAKLIYAGADLCSLGRGIIRVLHEQDGNPDALDDTLKGIRDSVLLAMGLTQRQNLDKFRGLWQPSN
jgi:isopentenyl-diphosphate Delta-isomerase